MSQVGAWLLKAVKNHRSFVVLRICIISLLSLIKSNFHDSGRDRSHVKHSLSLFSHFQNDIMGLSSSKNCKVMNVWWLGVIKFKFCWIFCPNFKQRYLSYHTSYIDVLYNFGNEVHPKSNPFPPITWKLLHKLEGKNWRLAKVSYVSVDPHTVSDRVYPVLSVINTA